MKIFEICYTAFRLFLPSLNYFVYKKIRFLVKSRGDNIELLDVGGRKSHQTINIPAKITITDIPRESNVQNELNLGINDKIIKQLFSRRSNVTKYIIDDMVDTRMPPESFDIIIAIEVLEHVEKDSLFIENVYNLLKPQGIFFMTTPNGENVKNVNPDHVRHYTRNDLLLVIKTKFTNVDCNYIILENSHYYNSLRSWSLFRPFSTIIAIISSLINNFQSNFLNKKINKNNARHLSVVAIKDK
jgi:SAM-dependent methyltransferase